MSAVDAATLAAYVESVSSPEPPSLTAAREFTRRHRLYPRMACSHPRGRLLKLLTQLIAPATALEIGSYTGCSALAVAEGLPEGAILHAIEIDDESEPALLRHFAASPFGNRIKLHIGDALKLIPALAPELTPLDMAIIDGNKRNYTDYLELILPLMDARGGWILADNTLWDGKAALADARDAQTLGIRRFNALVASHPRLETALISDGDGLSLIRVKPAK